MLTVRSVSTEFGQKAVCFAALVAIPVAILKGGKEYAYSEGRV